MRTRMSLGLALTALGLWPLACNCDDQLSTVPGSLRGQFCHDQTHEPLGRAEVTLQNTDGTPVAGKTATTDVTGKFEMLEVEPGTYKAVTDQAGAHREQEVTIKTQELTEFTDPACTKPQPQGGGVRGRFCNDARGQWVAFAQAWLSTPGNSGDIKYMGATDATGKFEVVGVTPGTYDLHVVLDDYSSDVTDIPVAEGNITEVPSPESCDPPPGGTIEGRVCDEGISWLADARAYVVVPGGSTVEDTTDALGRYTLVGVPPGDVVVHVEKGPFNRSYNATVVSGQTTTIPGPDSCEPPPPGGTIKGRVCAPDGQTWLAQAHVFLEATPTVQTYTDGDGRYTLTNVPLGHQVVKVEKGSFTSTFEVDVPSQTPPVEIPEGECMLVPTITKVAVVNGQYDNVRCVLTGQGDPLTNRPGHSCNLQGLGLDPANVRSFDGENILWGGSFLANYSLMAQYDIIFFNCGINEYPITTGDSAGVYAANLRHYVENGGSVYASDWAAPIVEQAFPEFIDWAFAMASPSSPENVTFAKVGDTQTVNASVVDPGIQSALNRNTVSIGFNLPYWVAMQGVSSATRVYFRGSVTTTNPQTYQRGNLTDIPFTVGFNVGQGKVLYTSFHFEQNVTDDMLAVLNLLVFEL